MERDTTIILLLSIGLMLTATIADSAAPGTSQFLQTLQTNYSREMRPYTGDRPVEVKCSVSVAAFSKLDETNMDYTLTFYLRKKWEDPRLRFGGTDSVIFQSDAAEVIWVPVTLFPEEKEGKLHDLTDENQIIQIWPNGTVVKTMRLTMTFICHMSSGRFPMDSHLCSLMMQSLAYPKTEMLLSWDENAILMREDIHVPTFHLGTPLVQKCESSEFHMDDFSCLEILFPLDRYLSKSFLQIYLTSTLVVLLSWISFWINPRSEPARVTIGMTSVLTISTQVTGAMTTIPAGTNASAVDVWLATCLLFVFAVLIEFAAVSYGNNKLSKLQGKSQDSKQNQSNSGIKNDDSKDSSMVVMEMGQVAEVSQGAPPTSNDSYVHYSPGYCKRLRNCFKVNEPEDMDHCCRILFPTAFIMFNLLYWCAYML